MSLIGQLRSTYCVFSTGGAFIQTLISVGITLLTLKNHVFFYSISPQTPLHYGKSNIILEVSNE